MQMANTKIKAASVSREKASVLPALGIAAFALAIGLAAFYAHPGTGEMAVVFAPGTTEKLAHSAILAAGGRFVSPTRLDNIAVAYAVQPDFVERVRALGGLFTLAARGLCTPSQSTTS